MHRTNKLLIISQVYVPDPAAVGQYMADVATAMVKRGWKVHVLTADRGYHNPKSKYLNHENINGVQIKRLPLSSYGIDTFALRMIAAMLFTIQSILRGLFLPGVSCILVSTSPPICSFAAIVISYFRRIPIKYWVMDLNPDQLVALGFITEKSLSARLLNYLNRLILKRAKHIITLDHYMAERLNLKLDISNKLSIIPPWPLQAVIDEVGHNDNHFRKNNGLEDKFIIMYSGNHTFTNPVTTVLQAALTLQEQKDLIFIFIGGGFNKHEVDNLIQNKKPSNILSFPYQPLSEIKYSLSAADIHLVSIGDDVVGIVHPSKIYGAMAVGRPILLLGPEHSFAGTIIKDHQIGWYVKHGDIPGAISAIEAIISSPAEKIHEMGQRAKELTEKEFNMDHLLKRMCDVIES